MGSLPHVVEDCLGIVQVFSDGSILRSEDINFPMEVQDDGSAVWKDCLFDEKHNLYLRLYKPRSPSAAKLPILYFFHGGGFCVGSRTWPNCHSCCLRLASALQVLVVAPDYRLAPEHRLPAALDDALTAVKWLKNEALLSKSGGGDEWLGDGVDFDRVFILGDSSGGNLAHHLAVELGRGSPDLAPVRVRGYVLMAPFFGGTVRTKSEAEGPPEQFLNLEILDRFWRLSVPIGNSADHPLANPFGPSSPSLESIELGPILVLVGGNEVMKDRIEEYSKRLKEMGKDMEGRVCASAALGTGVRPRPHGVGRARARRHGLSAAVCLRPRPSPCPSAAVRPTGGRGLPMHARGRCLPSAHALVAVAFHHDVFRQHLQNSF
ncbi:putative carboxylesterase 15 [Sesamum angolense]|uniref:Carboxylesterase 15 n=1 Tax=Sesamum angolense TaxID=2727404 RepID=A0AAE1WNG9_9LAMI|nr:putative carboxylesterase 15 [Sesamum angolense]